MGPLLRSFLVTDFNTARLTAFVASIIFQWASPCMNMAVAATTTMLFKEGDP